MTSRFSTNSITSPTTTGNEHFAYPFGQLECGFTCEKKGKFNFHPKKYTRHIIKPDHKNKKPRHVAENPWN
jgi:hypothetical protein